MLYDMEKDREVDRALGSPLRNPKHLQKRKRVRLIAMCPEKSVAWCAGQLGVKPDTIKKACRDYGLSLADYRPQRV